MSTNKVVHHKRLPDTKVSLQLMNFLHGYELPVSTFQPNSILLAQTWDREVEELQTELEGSK